MYDLIIVGAGPAALAATTYAQSKRLKLLMIYEDAGGWTGAHQRLVADGGDEQVPGEEAVRVLERLVRQSAAALNDQVTQISKPGTVFQVATEHNGEHESAAVILATGATPIMLDVPGGEEFLGQGLGYSVTTHAYRLAGKSVAVIGTTERALRGVAELAQTAALVYLICPEPTGLSTPLAHTVTRCSNVEVLAGFQVKEIAGGFNVEIVTVARGAEKRQVNVDAAFVDLGLVPNSACVRAIAVLDEHGAVKIDAHNATTVPGLFAAGDVTTTPVEQKLIAVGEGARAAWSAYAYILTRRLALEPA